MKTWICIVCGFIYDEAAGLPGDGAADRQFNGRQAMEGHGVVINNRLGLVQLAQPPLGGDLPGGGGADEECVVAVFEGVAQLW